MRRSNPNSDVNREDYDQDEYDDDTKRSGVECLDDRPKQRTYAIEAHLRLAKQKQEPRLIASCAAEALNMLLQLYKMPRPPFKFTTTRDNAGRSVFSTTLQVKCCIASAKEYNKKLCKQAVCHQLLIFIHNRYPRLNIPVYPPPQTVLTKFMGNSADICELAKEIRNVELDEKPYYREAKPPAEIPRTSTLLVSSVDSVSSAVANLSQLVDKFPGVNPPVYLGVTEIKMNSEKHEVLCNVGCEVVKGVGHSPDEAKENSADKMLRLLGQVEPSAACRYFKVSGDNKKVLADSAPEVEYKLLQRKSNDYWAIQLKVEAFGAAQTQSDSLRGALEKAKAVIEEALRDMNDESPKRLN